MEEASDIHKRNLIIRWPVQIEYITMHTKPKPTIFFKKIGHTLMKTSQLMSKRSEEMI